MTTFYLIRHGEPDWSLKEALTPDNWQADSVGQITELWKDYMNHEGRLPEGESRLWETKASVLTRTTNVLRQYANHSKVIVVCHGMIIATLLGLVSEEIRLCGVYEYNFKKII